ncbi:MAG: flavodoxin family protein [Lachnospiraceae bacterium]|nr:flavodoxin family protein [Lachnospiraceae bacterium]
MKKVLVVSTSLRDESNSDTLAIAFLRGAKEAGNETEYVTLQDKTISFCKGCNACQHGQKPCVIKDDAVEIAEKIKNADVVAFATPIYFYEMAGQMKTMLDRCYPLYAIGHSFKDVYLIATSASPEEKAMDGAIKGLEGWVECSEGAHLAGVVKGVGIEFAGDAFKNNDMLQIAYDMGKNV